MKLHELHIDKLGASMIRHRYPTSGAIPAVAGYFVNPAHASGCQDNRLRVKDLKTSAFAIISECADDPLVICQQLYNGMLLEEINPLVDPMVLKRPDHFQSGPVTNVREARIFVPAEITLKDPSVFCPVE
jgi:hypothetical protein